MNYNRDEYGREKEDMDAIYRYGMKFGIALGFIIGVIVCLVIGLLIPL